MLNGNPEEELPDAEYEQFKREFELLTGIRLSLYKEKQMKRRINTLIERKRLSGYAEFVALLKAKPAELAAFVDYITINVTEFFRTPDHWKYMEENVLAELKGRNGRALKIWSCACSTGEEPYSLAMSLMELGAENFRILATDIDESVLRRARQGSFDERAAEALPEAMRERYFSAEGRQLVVRDKVRAKVEFQKLDLLRDEFPRGCDLIVCRNVLIYFTEEGKMQIYEQFFQSLRPGGYLFTGNTEQIIYYKAFGFKKLKNYIYRKE